MRSLRSSFSALFMFGALLFALLNPSRALAEWADVGSTKYVCISDTYNGSFGTGSLFVSPISSGQLNGKGSLVPMATTRQYTSLTGMSSGSVFWALVPVSGGNIPAGKKFRINTEGMDPYAICYSSSSLSDHSTYYLSPVNIRYWVKAGSWQQVQPDSSGLFSVDSDVSHVVVSFTASNATNIGGWYALTLGGLSVVVQVPDGEPTVEGYIQDQTEELKSTEGSNGIVDGSQGQQIAQGLNFVQQTGQFMTGAFDAVANADASTGLMFPGLTIMGHEIIAAQEVPFLGYLGTNVENQIRNGVTAVLFLAWIMGLRSIYHKIFLGEQEVEVVDE